MPVFRFVGGTLDGQTKVIEKPHRVYVVPVRMPEVGHADDFRWINLDEVWNGRPAHYENQQYHLKTMRNADGCVVDRYYELAPA